MFTFSRQPGSLPIHLLYEEEHEPWLRGQPEAVRAWLKASGFRAEKHKIVLVPDEAGRPGLVACGLGKRLPGEEFTLWHTAGLPERLPDGDYHLATELDGRALRQFAQGWAYGQYRFDRFRRDAGQTPKSVRVTLPATVDTDEIIRLHAACTLARDLINTPASHLLPEQLAAAAMDLASRHQAQSRVIVGDDLLQEGFPAIHGVGRASSVAPRLVEFHWGKPDHPRVALVGKGVCFDSGGLDIKPPASMLLMKKDMGGAACVLGLAQAVMDAGLPVRLHVVIPAVENAVSGNAYRPGDVLPTRKGLNVEIGNTDAEGRLVLADAIALADAAQPDLLIDLATLTGAARIALGPELPALFANDDGLAADVLRVAAGEADPFWRLPLWTGYDDELASKIADLNNVSSSGFSGAIIGALFLRRFVAQARHWLHLDLYGWNARERPGRPAGAEPQAVRALYAYLKQRYTGEKG